MNVLTFQDDYRWLSNFTPFEKSLLGIDGLLYRTVEHFYVALKSEDLEVRKEIALTEQPGKVKRLGRKIKLRTDWEDIKLEIMTYAIDYKFSTSNPLLMQKLIDTGDAAIQEGNYWNDTYWGVCLKTGVGENKLGKIIMARRNKLRYFR